MISFLDSKILKKFLPIFIFLFAFSLRVYGINWDQNQHLHPDERFLTMVTLTIQWPKNLTEFFNTNSSPLNPHNNGFGFYVYGTFPLFFTKAFADFVNKTDYNTLTIVGRLLSALFDSSTTFLVYLITLKIIKKKYIALLGMFFYSVSVLPIQISHFYTVDPFLTFFVVLSFYFLLFLQDISGIKYTFIKIVPIAISFGLAFASKIQALFFLPVLIIGMFIFTIMQGYTKILLILLIFGLFSFLTIRIAQPYLFAGNGFTDFRINPKAITNWRELNTQYSDTTYKNADAIYFPPATMFIHAKDYIFPLENILLWGSGMPLGLTTICGVIFLSIKRGLKFNNPKNWLIILLLLWVVCFSLYQSQLFAKYLRYFYILYPFYAIISAIFFHDIYELLIRTLPSKRNNIRKKSSSFQNQSQLYIYNKIRILKIIIVSVSALTFIWAIAFVSIYSRKNTRVTASEWIYKNIPRGSNISYEHWDDSLPLCLTGYSCSNIYNLIELPLYNKDTPEKWKEINVILNKLDYIILSSNRLYGSITTVPEIYPQTFKFYQSLFDGSLGFTKIAEFTSRPRISLPIKGVCITPPWIWYGKIARDTQECFANGISFVDDYADESFTVYDHPKVLIYKNESRTN